jgi:hypothetical protein
MHSGASAIIDQHGDDAALKAAERIDKQSDEKDAEGVITWRAILRAIEELTRGRREGEPVN